MAEQFANNAASTLDGAINDSTTTIAVATGEGSRFPSIGNFRLMVGLDPFTAEIVLATSRSGDTLTVIRGQEGTVAQSWGSGTSITHIVTAGAIEEIRTQFSTVGNEIYTTDTVSIDPNGTVASAHSDGNSKLYVNGEITATKYNAGEIPLSTMGFGYVADTTQSFIVPNGVTSLRVKMWGPGGGTGSYSSSGGGGPGGYTSGILSVTPGETLLLAIGSGGKKPVSSTGNGGDGGWPGGGYGTRGDASGGGGGGLTGIFTSSLTQGNALMIAGGGGGSTGFGNFGAGGGGGTSGGSGTSGSGGGGTQIAGGLGGSGQTTPPVAGSALQGGVAFSDQTSGSGIHSNDCGGGGSGYFGGGAGQGDGRAGGGGSGFIHATRVSAGSTVAGPNAASGSGATLPPNSTDANYIAGVGVGAATGGVGVGGNGGDGYAILQWGGITSLDLDSIDFANSSTITTNNNDISISSGPNGSVSLTPGSTTLTLQSATDFILSTLVDTRFDINSAQKFKMYSSGAVVIGTATNNDTSAEAQAGFTGPLINMSSVTGGSISSVAGQALVFNNVGYGTIQGHSGVTFRVNTGIAGFFDSNSILRLSTGSNTTTSFQGASWPQANIDYLYLYNSSGSCWQEIISAGSNTRAAIQVINNYGSVGYGVSLYGAGPFHSTPEYVANGIIEQSGTSTSALVFTKRDGSNGSNFSSTGAIWQSGAWTIGRTTNNDTSTEAQAGLTGPLLNITQTTGGTLTTIANQSLLYNSAGVNISQGHSGVRQIVGTTTILDTTSTGTTVTGLITATSKFVVGTSGPTITQGTGVPSSSENNGSIFLRTDGSASTGIYTRQGGAWYAINSRYTPTDSNTIINWKFDESGSPYSNSGSGSALNLTTFTGTPASVTGIFNKGLGCAGTILSTGNSTVNEPNATAVTVSAWVKARSYAAYGTIVNKSYRNDNSWTSPFVSLYLSLTNIGDGSWAPAITTTGGVLTQPTQGGVFRIPLGEWTLLAFTYDGSNLRSYINGALSGTTAIASAIDYGTHGPWDVGGVSNAGTGQYWDGLIDDVRIESVVRSQAYLEAMYKNGIGRPD